MTCIPGRPFLVDGAPRVAENEPRSDWLRSSGLPDVSALSPELRENVGCFYAECAALEHASVAAFSRFTLGLLAVGAPADLVAESVRATADEVEHARTAYGLASHFLGRPIGPGALATHDAFDETLTLEGLALATFVEGCINETLSALEAREAALSAEHPALREVLGRIADDEARHSELAFRFVAWALERSSPTLRARIARAVENAESQISASTPGNESVGLQGFGVLSAEHRRALRTQGFHEVITPCVKALLERSKRGSASPALRA
jgi:hypothetical protein